MEEEIEVKLPKLGESILSATIVQWFKKEGDLVMRDEPLLEVSTDKVNSEIPSPVSGMIKEILAVPDEELNVGDALAVITTQEVSERSAGKAETQETPKQSDEENNDQSSTFFSPALLRMAQEKNVTIDELQKIKGSGSGGRVTKKDLETYLSSHPKKETASLPDRIKMTGLRKAIAENMMRSFQQVPPATLITEVDVSEIMKLIKEEKEGFFSRYGVKLTITSFIARALAKALKEYPLLNSSIEGDTILVKRSVNLGIAVSVDQGLLVPVVRDLDKRSLVDIAKGIQEISSKARNNKLKPDDVQEGTISLTNFGMSGIMVGIPIIRHPEVAIVGVGAVKKKVVALDDDSIGIRSILGICLTFDHRVVDGMYGCGFLSVLQKHIENDLSISN